MQELLRAGILFRSMFKDPGNQGPAIAGTHGIGVRTPIAAAVALATKGLAIEVHIPHVGTFKMGFESEIFPPGLELTRGLIESIFMGVGVVPKEHVIIAPVTH